MANIEKARDRNDRELQARVEGIAARARAAGTARPESPVETRIDPSIIGTGTPRPERKVLQNVEPPAPPAPRAQRASGVASEPRSRDESRAKGSEPSLRTRRRPLSPNFKSKVCACDGCEIEFAPRSGRQKFCSPRCANRDKHPEGRGRGMAERTCTRDGCEVKFTPETPRTEYCSPECGAIANRKRNRKASSDLRSERANTRKATSAALERYLDLLFEMADKDPTDAVLDRIERALRVA